MTFLTRFLVNYIILHLVGWSLMPHFQAHLPKQLMKFYFREIVWPDGLNKNKTILSQLDGQVLTDIINDHGLEQLIHFLTREENKLDLIITCKPGQFQDIHAPDKLSDHDIVAGTLKTFIPPKKKPRWKVYLYQKGDYNSMRKDTLNFANEKYFNGHSNTHIYHPSAYIKSTCVCFK